MTPQDEPRAGLAPGLVERFEKVLEACSTLEGGLLDEPARANLRARFDAFSAQGIRVLAVATRKLELREDYGRADESALDLALISVAGLYVAAAELVKRRFYAVEAARALQAA